MDIGNAGSGFLGNVGDQHAVHIEFFDFADGCGFGLVGRGGELDVIVAKVSAILVDEGDMFILVGVIHEVFCHGERHVEGGIFLTFHVRKVGDGSVVHIIALQGEHFAVPQEGFTFLAGGIDDSGE